MLNHTDCPHPATKKDRAACRKERAQATATRTAQVADLIEVFTAGWEPHPNHWIWYAARRFASYDGDNLLEAANAILDHFHPSGDAATDDNRRRNGYIITENPHFMRSITLRSAS